jgi:hypothetical protein
MTYKKIIDKIDFSGGERSFFDFWHLHVDFDEDGNKDWKSRKKYLDEQIKAFYYLKTKLVNYPHSFQLWIGIDEDDSSQDGVYIHSPNPNNDYFPHLVDNDEKINFKSLELRDYLINSGLTLIKSTNLDTNYYFLFDKSFGTPLTKG